MVVRTFPSSSGVKYAPMGLLAGVILPRGHSLHQRSKSGLCCSKFRVEIRVGAWPISVRGFLTPPSVIPHAKSQ